MHHEPPRRRFLQIAGAMLSPPFLNEHSSDRAMTSTTALPAKLQPLFERTKQVCFGRYALEVPEEAESVWGYQGIGGGFKMYVDRASDVDQIIRERWNEALTKRRDAEMIGGVQNGPVAGAKFIWFYTDKYMKELNARNIFAVIPIGRHAYSFADCSSPSAHKTPEDITKALQRLARGIRPWDNVSVPTEPGVCINSAFITEDSYSFRERMSIGLYFPSLPDVSFSVMSNKNQSTQGENGMGLLAKVDKAALFPGFYPYRFLRRARRELHGQWQGEEALSVSKDDHALRFEWQQIGHTGDVAKPAYISASLYNRVEDNRVGAASGSSISERDAVALWDRLLPGLKFRVPVPGCSSDSVALRTG